MTIITYTTILHQAREKLGITTNEYCVADIVYHLSNNPKSKIQGWCFASKQSIGKFIGITKASVLSIITRLEIKGIIEKDKETKYLRTTEKWFNIVVLTKLRYIGKETMPSVKKLYHNGKETIPTAVKKMTDSGKETIPNIYIDNNINKDINIVFNIFWDLYEKKNGLKSKVEKKWNSLTDKDRKNIIDYIPKYKEAQPDKQFRKHPMTFLNNESWKDELISNNKPKKRRTYFQGDLVIERKGKQLVMQDGEWKEFCGEEKDLVVKYE